MAGGDTLRTQTLAFGVVRNAKQLQKGAARLLSALQQVRWGLHPAGPGCRPCLSRGAAGFGANLQQQQR
jgi:hypothetical protein